MAVLIIVNVSYICIIILGTVNVKGKAASVKDNPSVMTCKEELSSYNVISGGLLILLDVIMVVVFVIYFAWKTHNVC